MAEQVGGPCEATVTKPGGCELLLAMGRHQFADADLVGLRGGGGKGERDVAEAQVEQPVAAARLAIIIALRGRTAQDLDLAVIEPQPLIKPRDMRLSGALVRQR